MTPACLDQSFVNARPGAFRLEDTDCKFPDDDVFVRPDGRVESSCECSPSACMLLSFLFRFGFGGLYLLICNLTHVALIDHAYTCGVYLPSTDHGWKFRYSATCLAPTVKFASSLKTPGYSQFLELDRRIRTFPLPSHLQSPLDESPEGWADDPSLAMQQYGVVCERESSKHLGDIR